MFIKHHGYDTTIMFMYINDILRNDKNNAYLKELVQCLHNKFALMVLGEVSYFLDIEITRTKSYL